MSAKEALPLIALGVATGGAGFAAAGALGASSTAAAVAGFGAASTVLQGVAGASAAKAQRNEARLRQQAERTQQAANEVATERKLRAVQQAQRAAFAAGGVSLSSGTPAIFGAQAASEAGKEISQGRVASGTRQSIFNLNAKSANTAATFSLVGGLVGAGGKIAQAGE